MAETKVRIRGEGGSQAAGELGQVGQAAQQMANQVGGAFGSLGQMLGPAGPIAASIALTVKAGQDALAIAREAEAELRKIGGTQAATGLELALGPGASGRFARMGVSAGISADEAVRAAYGMAGTLGAAGTEQAFGAFAGLRRAGYVSPEYGTAMAQLMRGGVSTQGAQNLAVMGLRTGASAEQVSGFGRLTSLAQGMGVDPAEALAMDQIIRDLGGNTMQTQMLLSNLSGDDPTTGRLIRQLGANQGGLSQRLQALARGSLTPEQLSQMGGGGGRGGGTAVLSQLLSRGGEIRGLAGPWAQALGGGADLLAGYQPGAEVREDIEARESEAAVAAARAGRPLWLRRLERGFEEAKAGVSARGLPWYAEGAGGAGTVELVGQAIRNAVRAGASDGAREAQKNFSGY